MKKCAWIGLGVMGYPMAGYLQRNGYDVTVYNRTTSKAEQWVSEYKGSMAVTPAMAANEADFIFTCVGNDNDVDAVYNSEQGIMTNLKHGAIMVDHTTASASIATMLAANATNQHAHFIDAPVSGGEKGACDGILTIMCGGDDAIVAQAREVMVHYGKSITHIGPVGHGQKAKMVNQICIAGLLQGLAEAMHLGQHIGLDMDKTLNAIKGGASQSWQMDNRASTMLKGEYDFGFQVNWMRKDLAICFNEAKQHDVALPVTSLIDQYYAMIQQLGGGLQDTSSLKQLLDHIKG